MQIISGNAEKPFSAKSNTFLAMCLFYISLVLWFTVFGRPVGVHTPQLELLWSYKKWLAGNWSLGQEILGNIGLFIPFGFLLSAAVAVWKRSGIKVLIAGFVFSSTIEILQFLLWRGLFEFDDIINNTAGTVLGYLLYQLLQRWVPKSFFVLANSIIGILLVLSGVAIYFNYYSTGQEVQSNISRGVCFQLERAAREGDVLLLSGFAFIYDQTVSDVNLVLKSTKDGKEIRPDVEYGLPRPNVNAYFRCDTDYSKTGFSASVPDVDSEEEYEVFMKVNPFVELPTGVYITGTDIHYAKQKNFIAPEVAGTDLEEIVKNGYLRVYRPDRACYVYQYKGYLYWLADKGFAFEEDGTTYIQYHLWTTQIENLPQKRLKNKWYWDNIGSFFEKYEITNRMDCGRYRVCKRKLPTEYAITSIVTGYYKNKKWVWKEFFRPVYEF